MSESMDRKVLRGKIEAQVLSLIQHREYGDVSSANFDAQLEYEEDHLDSLIQEAAGPAGFITQDVWVNYVREFFLTYGHEIRPTPITSMRDSTVATIELRNKLIVSEVQELFDAIEADDVVEVFDALLDLTYVTIGAMFSYGFPAEAGMAEVQRSNMTKLGEDGQPIYDDDGKVVKGPNYEPPALAPILEAAR